MLDVIIAGAGPAGAVSAWVLTRAGARVLVVDRETFPRDKLCGDTLSPGAVAVLASIGLEGGPLVAARPLHGMLVSGPHRTVPVRYGDRRVGLAIRRSALDAWLIGEAVRAGARFESGWVAQEPLVQDTAGGDLVRGLRLVRRSDRSVSTRVPALMTIAADGSRSTVARSLGLIAHPERPRRWAFGAYASGIREVGDLGEMHIRPGRYLGIAPVADDLANVCAVTGPRPAGRTPLAVIQQVINEDPRLRKRFAGAAFEPGVRVLGPLAVTALAAGVPGLLLAGDAAGFVDPMTGDGLFLAIQGAILATREALRTLEHGDFAGAVVRLQADRQAVVGAKLRFNRTLRALVDSPAAIRLAEYGAAIAPGVVGRVVRYAGGGA